MLNTGGSLKFCLVYVSLSRNGYRVVCIKSVSEPNAKDEADAVNGMSDEEMSKTIDSILEENDLNKDGFIDYAEFVRNQRVADTNAV